MYSLTISNNIMAGPTAGTVTVTEMVPSGLNLISMTGEGWSCMATVCTRDDSLGAGASYPPLTAVMNVAADAPSQFVNQVTISGGGAITASTSDLTNIAGASSKANSTADH